MHRAQVLTTRKLSTGARINPRRSTRCVVLLRIQALHSRQFFWNTSVFTTLTKKTTWPMMLHTRFLYLTPNFSPTCLLSTLSRTVHGRSPYRRQNFSTLRRKLCDPELPKMRDSRGYTCSGPTSVPPCRSILLSKIHPFLASISSKSTAIAFGTPSTPRTGWTNLGKNRFFRNGGKLQHPTSWMVCPTPEKHPALKHTLGLTST